MASLAVKYRPKDFDAVSEQQLVVEILENECKDDELANRNFLLIGPAGCGKAQPLDARILTPTGWIQMKDVKPGPEVITHRGLISSVLRVFPQGERENFKITLLDGRSIRVSDDHLNCVIVHTTSGDVAVILTTKQVISYVQKGMKLSIPFPTLNEVSYKDTAWYKEYLSVKSVSDTVVDGCVIDTIESLGYLDCQCIYIDDEDHTYVSENFIYTHNTTLARIMANKLNNNVGEPLEIDAASHSGVEGMREIIRQAQQYPIGCKYKTFIIDECFSGDTKVLTNQGFKAFQDLTQDELIAQYDEGFISFVKPTRWIKKEYQGEGYYFNPGYKACEVLMTAHHVQPVVDVSDPLNPVFREDYINNLEFNAGDRVATVGILDGEKSKLEPIDEVIIASKLYASRAANPVSENITDCMIFNALQVLASDMYMSLLSKLSQAGIAFTEDVNTETGESTLKYSIPKCDGLLSSWFDLSKFNQDGIVDLLDKLAEWSNACINLDIFTPVRIANTDFLKNWDNPHSGLIYSGSIEGNVQFIASLCYLAGSPVEVVSPNRLKYATVEMTTPSKRKYEINEEVYCVEVPSNKIIVQASGFPFVTGNCHALSSAAWQSVLKTLEESPARSVFFFATTNPEKIPDTILSRVQTFQLSKISLEGIAKRLKYVCDQEIAEGRQLTYTEEALQFLGKLAKGGMRDALTLLDRALAYSSDITVENLSKSLNLPNYDDYFTLLGAYAKKDNEAITKLIDQVYNSGVNFVRWFEGFHSFVINVTKFIFMKDINATIIPSYYYDKISKYEVKHSVVCLKLANKLLSLISDLKSTQYLQEVALTYLCTPSGGK